MVNRSRCGWCDVDAVGPGCLREAACILVVACVAFVRQEVVSSTLAGCSVVTAVERLATSCSADDCVAVSRLPTRTSWDLRAEADLAVGVSSLPDSKLLVEVVCDQAIEKADAKVDDRVRGCAAKEDRCCCVEHDDDDARCSACGSSVQAGSRAMLFAGASDLIAVILEQVVVVEAEVVAASMHCACVLFAALVEAGSEVAARVNDCETVVCGFCAELRSEIESRDDVTSDRSCEIHLDVEVIADAEVVIVFVASECTGESEACEVDSVP